MPGREDDVGHLPDELVQRRAARGRCVACARGRAWDRRRRAARRRPGRRRRPTRSGWRRRGRRAASPRATRTGGGPVPIRSSQLRGRPRITASTSAQRTRSSDAARTISSPVGRAVRRASWRFGRCEPKLPPPHPRREEHAVARVARPGRRRRARSARSRASSRSRGGSAASRSTANDDVELVADPVRRGSYTWWTVSPAAARAPRSRRAGAGRRSGCPSSLSATISRVSRPRVWTRRSRTRTPPPGDRARVEDGRGVDEARRDVREVARASGSALTWRLTRPPPRGPCRRPRRPAPSSRAAWVILRTSRTPPMANQTITTTDMTIWIQM